MKHILYFFFLVVFNPFASCQNQSLTERFNTLKAKLVVQPRLENYNAFHFLLSENYLQLTTEQRTDLRNTLEKQAKGAVEKLCSDREQGTKTTIKGRILNENNKPIPNAKISIFHADSHGYYAPQDSALKKMSENDPRICGFLKSDSLGNYEFHTVRPASYPNKYKGRTIPQHIHITIAATGFTERKIQMVFDDDPSMQNPYWRDWAKTQSYPIVKLLYEKDKIYGICDLVLHK